MRLNAICPTAGGLWMARKDKTSPWVPFYLWALTYDNRVIPYNPRSVEPMVDYEILSPYDEMEGEDPFNLLNEE